MRLLSQFLVGAIVATACAPADEPRDSADVVPRGLSRGGPAAVHTVDSVRLAEADSAYVAVAGGIAIGPGGAIAVSDVQSRRVLIFGRDGRLRAVIGRPGSGPGEFMGPGSLAFIGDSLLAVDDNGAGRLQLFTYPDGEFRREKARVGTPVSLVANGNSVWLGIPRFRLGSSVTEWDLVSDTLRFHGPIPDAYVGSQRLRQVYGYVAAAADSHGLFYSYVADTVVRRLDRSSGELTTFPIPARERRGVPSDVASRLLNVTEAEDYAGMLSSVVAINAPAKGVLQVVHFDVTYANKLITAEGFLTTIDVGSGHGCVDSPLSFSNDARPQVAFVGDTLVTIDQRVVGEASETYVRFLVQPRQCQRQGR